MREQLFQQPDELKKVQGIPKEIPEVSFSSMDVRDSEKERNYFEVPDIILIWTNKKAHNYVAFLFC